MTGHPNVYRDPWEDEGIDRGQRLRDENDDDEPPGAGVPCECGSFLHGRCRPAS